MRRIAPLTAAVCDNQVAMQRSILIVDDEEGARYTLARGDLGDRITPQAG